MLREMQFLSPFNETYYLELEKSEFFASRTRVIKENQ